MRKLSIKVLAILVILSVSVLLVACNEEKDPIVDPVELVDNVAMSNAEMAKDWETLVVLKDYSATTSAKINLMNDGQALVSGRTSFNITIDGTWSYDGENFTLNIEDTDYTIEVADNGDLVAQYSYVDAEGLTVSAEMSALKSVWEPALEGIKVSFKGLEQTEQSERLFYFISIDKWQGVHLYDNHTVTSRFSSSGDQETPEASFVVQEGYWDFDEETETLYINFYGEVNEITPDSQSGDLKFTNNMKVSTFQIIREITVTKAIWRYVLLGEAATLFSFYGVNLQIDVLADNTVELIDFTTSVSGIVTDTGSWTYDQETGVFALTLDHTAAITVETDETLSTVFDDGTSNETLYTNPNWEESVKEEVIVEKVVLFEFTGDENLTLKVYDDGTAELMYLVTASKQGVWTYENDTFTLSLGDREDAVEDYEVITINVTAENALQFHYVITYTGGTLADENVTATYDVWYNALNEPVE